MIAEVLHASVVTLLAGPTPSPTPSPSQPSGFPQLPPVPVPGLETPLATVIGWGKWAMVFFGIIGLIFCSAQMVLGRKNRHSMAADGASGIPWVLAGLALVSISSFIVGVFITP